MIISFIGIDLAWSARNRSGLAALVWDGSAATLHSDPVLADSDDSILAYVESVVGADSVLIAVDAPLLVPNETGQRPGEAALNRVFARYHAGAHPANRQRLTAYNGGVVRGEQIVARLAALGISHNAELTCTPVRQVFETYPHPAMIALFGLSRVLKYKAPRGIRRGDRLAAFQSYRDGLRTLAEAEPPLRLPDSHPLLAGDLSGLSGIALKGVEDRLDALFCAYIALYYWRWGTARCHIFGDMQVGYIVTPMPLLP